MGRINYGRVILGGIVGGIVGGLLDWFFQGVLLGQLWTDATKSINRPNAYSGAFLFYLFLVACLYGILVVLTYAAIRPRFGAGVRTAVYAGLLWSFDGFLTNMMNAVTGIYSTRLMLYSALFGMVEVVVGAIVGAALYKEAESAAAYPSAAAAR